MNFGYYFPIIMTIFGGLAYHLSSKSIPEQNPFFALTVAYTLQALTCFILLLSIPLKEKVPFAWNHWFIGLAVGSILLELGFILAYRAGWDLSNADLSSVAVVALLFVPIGMIFFQEPVSAQRIVGILICVLGLYLVR